MTKYHFELHESGQGRPLLMLPGSYATPSAWKGIIENLKGDFRIISTSLPGYGSTPEIRTWDRLHVDQMIEFVGQVVDAVGENVPLIGHSWGAHLALAASLRRRISPPSIISFEANPIYARPRNAPFEWVPEIDAMAERFEAAIGVEDPEAAAIIIDFYSRPGTFKAMPETVRTYCQATAATNMLDWRSAATFTPFFDEFSRLDFPVTLVRGSETPKPIVDVTDQLSANIANAKIHIVEGADHFLISTHSLQCAQIIEQAVAA